ncbi:hypothetical protein PR048_003543 [Dryococelus australis]|uniref:Uncharacterized protein n=1 Tax=Dryococelus australis TaxID=614101 RepID=A0ABQ9IND2_9NEOP|nr:hypothetical protein PR048_003543 [Dryococelus australis]
MEHRRSARTGETGDPRENPLTSGIARHDSHMQKTGDDPPPPLRESNPACLGGRRAGHRPATLTPPTPSYRSIGEELQHITRREAEKCGRVIRTWKRRLPGVSATRGGRRQREHRSPVIFRVVKALASYLGESGSIPGWVVPGLFTCRNRDGWCRNVTGLIRPLHSGAAPCSPRFTLVGSQDLDPRCALHVHTTAGKEATDEFVNYQGIASDRNGIHQLSETCAKILRANSASAAQREPVRTDHVNTHTHVVWGEKSGLGYEGCQRHSRRLSSD